MKQRKALLQSRVSLGLHMAGVFGVGAVTRRRVTAPRGQPPSKIPQGGPILPGRYAAGASRIAPTRRGAGEFWGLGYICGVRRIIGVFHCRGSASRLRVMPALYFRGQPPSKIPQGGPILPGRYDAGASRIAPTRRGAGEIGVIAWGSFKRAATRRCVVAPVYFVFARIHADMDSMNR
jgi:hypothetical protein